MWHVSVAALQPDVDLRALAFKALAGVGDEWLGQWEDPRERAYHLRRRLAMSEQKPIGPAVDCRNSAEGGRRLIAAAGWLQRLPPVVQAYAVREVKQ